MTTLPSGAAIVVLRPSSVALARRLQAILPGSSLHAPDRKSTRLNSSHTVIYTLSLHDALPIYDHPSLRRGDRRAEAELGCSRAPATGDSAWLIPSRPRSEEHTSELQSHSDLHSFPTRRSSDL